MSTGPTQTKKRATRWAESIATWVPDVGNRGRLALGILVGALLVLHGLAPDFFLVDAYSLGLVGVLVLLALRPLLKSANVAGVAGVEFREEFEAAGETAQQVELNIDEQEEGQEQDPQQGLRDVHALFLVPDYLRELARRDPNVALTGLRIELERALRTAQEVLVERAADGDGQAKRTKRPIPLSRIVTDLRQSGHLDDDQAELALSIIKLGNRAAHGELIRADEAELVFEWADTLNRSFPVGYSLNFLPNLDFEEQGLVCEYEHCIEHMPLRDKSQDSCPVWGHDCPAGRRRIVTCPAAQARLAGGWPFPGGEPENDE
jgi:hypothetical protein